MSAKRTKSELQPGGRATSPAGQSPLLDETEAMLAFAAPVTEKLPLRIKEQLLARIRAAKATEANVVPPGWRFESASADAGWRSGRFYGVRLKTLSVDEQRDVVLVLIEMAAGARFPDHMHDQGGDEGIVISGDVITGGRLMRAGDYYFAAEGTAHVDTVSPTGCTALVTLTARAWKKWRDQMALG
jgi:quercetin dioxygenase-like cupin family protein